jgi:hypothetical protein
MKLAEALVNRADAQKRVEQIKARLVKSAKVQEGEKPPYSPQDLIKDLDGTLEELSTLIKQINKTNSSTMFQEGMTLTDAIAERDKIGLKRTVLTALIEGATVQQNRLTRSEIKYFSTFNIIETQKQVDDLAKQYRELDTKIQELNWQTELMAK